MAQVRGHSDYLNAHGWLQGRYRQPPTVNYTRRFQSHLYSTMSNAGKQLCHVALPQVLSVHSDDRDLVRDLNNYLQEHPSGNFTSQFFWDMTQSGPAHQVTHHATANCKSFSHTMECSLSYHSLGS